MRYDDLPRARVPRTPARRAPGQESAYGGGATRGRADDGGPIWVPDRDVTPQWHRPEPAGRPRGAAGNRRGRHHAPRLSGADGNERLIALTGGVLLVLLAIEGVTIVFLRPLLPVHFFVGMLIVGPVLLKAGATVYRFIRYYTGAPDYRRKGPPAPLLRLIGPLVLLSSLTVVGTGVGLALAGPGDRELLTLHKASFVIWFLLMTVHVLAYVWRVPRLVAADWRRRPGPPPPPAPARQRPAPGAQRPASRRARPAGPHAGWRPLWRWRQD